jgi:hypothetical protein
MLQFFLKIEAIFLPQHLFLINANKKSVLAVTILLRKVSRYVLSTCYLGLTLLRRQRKEKF